MFGMFRRKSLESPDPLPGGSRNTLDDRYAQIASAMIAALNRDGIGMMDRQDVEELVREILADYSGDEILNCRISIACFFSMASVACAAFDDREKALAKYICAQCKPAGVKIMAMGDAEYNPVERAMIGRAFDMLRKIDIRA
jgi:hypothetical protein